MDAKYKIGKEMVEAKLQIPRKLRVLIVDDEELVAGYFSDLLLSVGCETTIFHDSHAALENFKMRLDDYDLVISDICMPNMTGDCLAEEILKLRPDMPIVLCSGYSPHVDKQKVLDLGVKEFMKKPIDSLKLVQIVSELNGALS